jgi:hypothetical protein
MGIAADIRTNVLAIATAYQRATGLSLATISARFYGNAGFLSEFRSGRQTISIDKLEVMAGKFRKAWPDGAEWPYLGAMFLVERPKERRQRRRPDTVGYRTDPS